MLVSEPVEALEGDITVPGDKSQSHRALILSALSNGKTEIDGALWGEDNQTTASALRSMGVCINRDNASGRITVQGVGLHGLSAPKGALNFGNAGTGIRLMAGLLSWQSFDSVLTGDTYLQMRPMERIAKPLRLMGADIELDNDNFAPIRIRGRQAPLSGLTYRLPVSSAQIKSAILLAGLGAKEPVSIEDVGISRDHTEIMMRYLDLPVESRGHTCSLLASREWKAKPLEIVSDISSAAFFLVAGSLVPNSDLLLKQVGLNPTRRGVIDLLLRMGADLELHNERRLGGGELVADIRVRSAPLQGITITAEDVPTAIDELPVLMIAAACASGMTTLSGAGELRVKESDRIHSVVNGLTALGVLVEELPDGMCVQGGEIQGGVVESEGDHRVVMAFSIAGAVASGPVTIRDSQWVSTSFPEFESLSRTIGLNIQEVITDE